MLLHWLWLSTRTHLPDRTKVTLLQHFQNATEVYYAAAEDYACVQELSEEGLQSLTDKNLTRAREIFDECNRKGIHILTLQDAGYPAQLRNIADPPVVLYYVGHLPDFESQPVIAVVGTRKATSYGLTTAKRMGYQIASCGGVVVSGVAAGIDAAAMQGALSAGNGVIGVLGCGVDVVYPASNRSLYADIRKQGCLISEFAPGTEPFGWNFPKRNRIISGMSRGVLVVEAPEKSGALLTARLAAEQGREVFAVPGNIDMPTSAGSNELLRNGGILVGSGWDVLMEYAAQYPDKIHNCCKPGKQTAYPDELARVAAEAEKTLPKVAQKAEILESNAKKQKKVIDTSQSSHYIDAEKKHPPLSDLEQTVLNAVIQGMNTVDTIEETTQLSTPAVLTALTTLEVKGLVQRLPGKRVQLK